jgi:hypothetical protein
MLGKAEYAFTGEASQNSNGHFQIRVKVRSDDSRDISIKTAQLIKEVAEAVKNQGFTVQPKKEPKK